MPFNWTANTTREVVTKIISTTDFFNLKNKVDGARRYGYSNQVVKFTNNEGVVAYRGELQTTLDGRHYQSSKYGEFVATEAEAVAALEKSVAGAIKRYAKLAQNPANKIEHRA